MSRLPVPGSDDDVWGDILNDYLKVEHNADGTHKAQVDTSGSLTGGGDLSTSRTLSLVNDNANPGASRYYGTNSAGSKGYFPLPSGGGGGVSSVGAAAPITSSGGTTPVIGISVATSGAAGAMSAADKAKLDSVESGATADMTGSEILAALSSVDGSGSGLDADRLDGLEGSAYLKSNVQNMTVSSTAPTSPGVGDVWIDTSGS